MITFEIAYPINQQLSSEDKRRMANALLKELEPEKQEIPPEVLKVARDIQQYNLRKYKMKKRG